MPKCVVTKTLTVIVSQVDQEIAISVVVCCGKVAGRSLEHSITSIDCLNNLILNHNKQRSIVLCITYHNGPAAIEDILFNVRM